MHKKLIGIIMAFVMIFSCIIPGINVYADNSKQDINKVVNRDLMSNNENQLIGMPNGNEQVDESNSVNEEDRINDILSSIESFKDVSNEEILKISEYYNIDKDVLLKCETKGYSLEQCIYISRVASAYNFTDPELETLLNVYKNVENLDRELYITLSLKNEKPKVQRVKEIKKLILKGHAFNRIRSAYRVAEALQTDIEKLIKKESKRDNRLAGELGRLEKSDTEIVEKLQKRYSIDVDGLLEVTKEKKINLENVKQSIVQYETSREISSENVFMATASTYSTMNDGEKDNYKTYFNPPFYYRKNINEKINPSGGSLMLEFTDFSIPGINGLDSVVKTSYNSAKATLYRPISNDGDFYNTETHEEKHFKLGVGWSFNISFIRIFNEGDDLELHLGNGEVYQACIKNDGVTYAFDWVNYEPMEFTIKKDDSYTFYDRKAQFDTSSYLAVEYKDGRKEYFDNWGQLVCIMDRYGNAIKYEYEVDEAFGQPIDLPYELPLVASIEDSLGRRINFMYDIDGTGNREIWIASSGNPYVFYTLEQKESDEYVVSKRRQGSLTTYFDYQIQTAMFSSENKTGPGIENKHANLTKVKYHTGGESIYAYEKTTGNWEYTGYKEYYRIKTREDRVITGTSSYNTFNKEIYTYENEQSGYPGIYGGYPYDLPTDYTYKTTIADANNTQKNHTFDYRHLNVKEEVKENGTKLLSETVYEYFRDKYPTRETVKLYNTSGSYLTKMTERSYNNYGDLLTSKDELGHTTTYDYDMNYHVVNMFEKQLDSGVSMHIDYIIDSRGDVTKETQRHLENGVNKPIVIDYGHDSYGNITSKKVTKEDGSYVLTNYEYSPTYYGAYLTRQYQTVKDFNRTSSTVEESFTYEFNTGLVKTHTDRNNHTTSYAYDMKRIKTVTNPPVTKQDGTIENTTIGIYFDDRNDYVIVTNESGHKIKYIYDPLGKLKEKQEMKNGAYITFERTGYNSLGLVDWVELLKDSSTIYKTKYQYDALGRLLKTINNDNSYSTIVYDDALSKKTDTDEEGNIRESYFDYVGNLVKEIAYLDKNDLTKKAVTQYDYNFDKKLKKVIDGRNNQTNFYYDDLARFYRVVNAKNEATNYKYDNLGNLVEIINAKNESIKKQYDELNRLIVEEYPDLRKEYYKYDGVGNITYKKDRKVQEFTFRYDERNRLIEQLLGTNSIASFDYEKTGKLLWVKNPSSGKTDYLYYENGDLKQVTESDRKYIYYEYDYLKNRTKMIDHYGQVLTYGYDNRNRLKTVSIGTILAATYDYYLNGILKSITYAGGTNEEYSAYDGSKNLKTLINKKADGNLINKYEYTYDGVGNQKTKNENSAITTFDYDALNRVQSITQAGIITQAYTYDVIGNIDNVYSENFEVGESADYTNNELNQLVQYSELGKPTVNYTYYPNGLRKTKTANGVTTTYYYDGQNVIIEAENGNLKYRNIYGMNQIARQDAAGNTEYFLYNGHGDVVKTVDSAGNVKNSYEYDIYGKVTSAVESGIPNPMRYAGQMHDSESGLYYLRARYYDPRIGRFISEDTNKGDINNPSSLNLYIYCYNNPLKYVDPSGHEGDLLCRLNFENVTNEEVAQAMKTTIDVAATGYMIYCGVYGVKAGVDALRLSRAINASKAADAAVTKGMSSTISGFNAVETKIINEAKTIINSADFAKIKAAHEAGQSVTVNIGDRIIQYEPGLNASGMTMFGENGFLIGNEAFTSNAELSKTVLHELYRLNTSASAAGVSAGLATQETNAAFEFAKRAFEELLK